MFPGRRHRQRMVVLCLGLYKAEHVRSTPNKTQTKQTDPVGCSTAEETSKAVKDQRRILEKPFDPHSRRESLEPLVNEPSHKEYTPQPRN